MVAAVYSLYVDAVVISARCVQYTYNERGKGKLVP